MLPHILLFFIFVFINFVRYVSGFDSSLLDAVGTVKKRRTLPTPAPTPAAQNHENPYRAVPTPATVQNDGGYPIGGTGSLYAQDGYNGASTYTGYKGKETMDSLYPENTLPSQGQGYSNFNAFMNTKKNSPTTVAPKGSYDDPLFNEVEVDGEELRPARQLSPQSLLSPDHVLVSPRPKTADKMYEALASPGYYDGQAGQGYSRPGRQTFFGSGPNHAYTGDNAADSGRLAEIEKPRSSIYPSHEQYSGSQYERQDSHLSGLAPSSPYAAPSSPYATPAPSSYTSPSSPYSTPASPTYPGPYSGQSDDYYDYPQSRDYATYQSEDYATSGQHVTLDYFY